MPCWRSPRRATRSSCRCRSTSTTRWRSRWPAAASVRVADDERYQLRVDAIERAITDRTRAIVTISPNNPSGAVFSEASLRAVNDLCRDRGLFHISDEPTSTSPTASRARLARIVCRRGRAHHFAVLAFESLRVRRLADRLRGLSGSARVGDDEEPGHDSDLSDDCRADGRRRGARRWSRVLRPARPRARLDSRHRRVRVVGAWRRSPQCRRPTARSTPAARQHRHWIRCRWRSGSIREHKVAVIPATRSA